MTMGTTAYLFGMSTMQRTRRSAPPPFIAPTVRSKGVLFVVVRDTSPPSSAMHKSGLFPGAKSPPRRRVSVRE